jgi:hypothetical protein
VHIVASYCVPAVPYGCTAFTKLSYRALTGDSLLVLHNCCLTYYMRRNTPRFKALEGSNGLPKDVVEPPKFITGKHVAAIFEKLGFDATCGQKVGVSFVACAQADCEAIGFGSLSIAFTHRYCCYTLCAVCLWHGSTLPSLSAQQCASLGHDPVEYCGPILLCTRTHYYLLLDLVCTAYCPLLHCFSVPSSDCDLVKQCTHAPLYTITHYCRCLTCCARR